MKALSLQNPWPWLITHGYKRIENRSWNTTFRGEFLIHASKTWDVDCVMTGGGLFAPRYNFIEFIAKTDAYIPFVQECSLEELPLGGIVGIATLVDVVTESSDPWFFGEYGFCLENARPLPFTPCKGALNFWNVPPDVLQSLGL
jgi:hypothetical protein